MSAAILRPHVGKRAQPSGPILLLLDDFDSHSTSEVREEASRPHTVHLQVPPHTTAVSRSACAA